MDKLAEIMAWKRQEIQDRMRPVAEAEWDAVRTQARPSFYEALARPDRVSVISEIKRRSPSAGAIAEGASATTQAELYLNAGTDAISVLTDNKYFGGSLEDLQAVTSLIAEKGLKVPCIRKDFFVHPIQVLEAAQNGASAILIIVRALSDEEMNTLFQAARKAGLDALFEVHESKEISRAVKAGAKILGVNNRDLKRFKTDLAITEAVIPDMPAECVKVSESGIFTPEDVARVQKVGAQAVLVGEALMKNPDPAAWMTQVHAL